MFWPFSRNKNIFTYDTFYLTYDEPGKDERWETIKEHLPHAQRVDGIKGFDRAHKRCAELTKTTRLVIIDGDNSFVDHHQIDLKISKELLKKNYIFSYSSKNSINGLIYGNGGIKCWPKKVLMDIKSHENSETEDSSVDFCFTVPYYQIPQSPTLSNININSFQAFRAGYREGVKMCLNKGIPLTKEETNNLEQVIFHGNLFRLRTWCEIGRDVPYGIWAIFGARLGLFEMLSDSSILENIRDYDWFNKKWESVRDVEAENEALLLANKLKESFNFSLREYDPSESLDFKHTIKNPHREGLMFPEMSS